jgi:hypothetical protein
LAIMDRLYEEDTRSAIDLMDDVSNVWGIKSSPLTFAHENFLYDVVAHPCSQKNMNRQWYNNLAPDLKPFMKVRFLKCLYSNEQNKKSWYDVKVNEINIDI